jgi:hypothetical protein
MQLLCLASLVVHRTCGSTEYHLTLRNANLLEGFQANAYVEHFFYYTSWAHR